MYIREIDMQLKIVYLADYPYLVSYFVSYFVSTCASWAFNTNESRASRNTATRLKSVVGMAARLGWTDIGADTCHGNPVSVMSIDLNNIRTFDKSKV